MRRLLWTTCPEKLPIRRPTHVFSAGGSEVIAAVMAAHPHLGPLPFFSFNPPSSWPAHAFLPPGEGPYRVAGGGFTPQEIAGAVGRTNDPGERIDAVVEAAARLAAALSPSREKPAVVWSVACEGIGGGLVAVGAAKSTGRAVAISSAAPDALTLAACRVHGVAPRVVLDGYDLERARDELVELLG